MNKLKIAFFGISILFLTYFRENAFLILNGALNKNTSYKARIDIPEFLYSMSNAQIVTIKWLLTISLLCSFLFLNNLIIRELFNERKLVLYSTYLFSVICAMSFAIFTIAKFFDLHLYNFARILLGILQGPIFSMVTITVFFMLSNRQNIETKS